jgi:hypothetical protein
MPPSPPCSGLEYEHPERRDERLSTLNGSLTDAEDDSQLGRHEGLRGLSPDGRGRSARTPGAGGPDESKLYKNHNSGRGEPDGLAVASISLPYDILADLAVVALVQAGARKVIIAPDGITGIMDDHDEKNVQAYISYHGRDKLTIIPVKRAG